MLVSIRDSLVTQSKCEYAKITRKPAYHLRFSFKQKCLVLVYDESSEEEHIYKDH